MLILKRVANWKPSLLVISAGVASIVNLYTFLVVPLIWPTNDLGDFIVHNYLGATYMALIGSSVIPLSTYLFNNFSKSAILHYWLICAFILITVMIAGMQIAIIPFSYYGIMAAIFMQMQGMNLAFMIGQNNLTTASLCSLVQPFSFALLVTLTNFYDELTWSWMISWVSSATLSVFVFAMANNWKEFLSSNSECMHERIGFKKIISRMFIAASFPVFFQWELIIVGNFTKISLTEFAILQKLYISISISLFSNLSTYFISRDLKKSKNLNSAPDLKVFLMAFFGFLVVFCVGSGLMFFDRSERLEIVEIVFAAFVSCCFTICAYMNLRQTQTSPLIGGISFFISITIHGIVFYFLQPQNKSEIMILAGIFFFTYFLSALFFGKLKIFGGLFPKKEDA